LKLKDRVNLFLCNFARIYSRHQLAYIDALFFGTGVLFMLSTHTQPERILDLKAAHALLSNLQATLGGSSLFKQSDSKHLPALVHAQESLNALENQNDKLESLQNVLIAFAKVLQSLHTTKKPIIDRSNLIVKIENFIQQINHHIAAKLAAAEQAQTPEINRLKQSKQKDDEHVLSLQTLYEKNMQRIKQEIESLQQKLDQAQQQLEMAKSSYNISAEPALQALLSLTQQQAQAQTQNAEQINRLITEISDLKSHVVGQQARAERLKEIHEDRPATIVDISERSEVLTSHGDVVFLSYIENGNADTWKHAYNLHTFYPDVCIQQILSYNLRTYLLDASGYVYQPNQVNHNGEISIRLNKMIEADNVRIKKMSASESGLFLLTDEGQVLFSPRSNQMDALNLEWVKGAIDDEEIVDICSMGQVNIFLNTQGKLFCQGKGLKEIFFDASCNDIPDSVAEPIALNMLDDITVIEMKAGICTQPCMLYIKDSHHTSYVLGNILMSPHPKTFISEIEVADIVDIKLCGPQYWLLTTDGIVHHLEGLNFKETFEFDEKIIKLHVVKQGYQGHFYKVYAISESENISLFDMVKPENGWQPVALQSFVSQPGYGHYFIKHGENKVLAGLAHRGFFAFPQELACSVPTVKRENTSATKALSQ